MVNEDYLKNLNEAQTEAVIHLDGPLLIVAGAGTGKTKVLTSRISHLIKNQSEIVLKNYEIRYIIIEKISVKKK